MIYTVVFNCEIKNISNVGQLLSLEVIDSHSPNPLKEPAFAGPLKIYLPDPNKDGCICYFGNKEPIKKGDEVEITVKFIQRARP